MDDNAQDVNDGNNDENNRRTLYKSIFTLPSKEILERMQRENHERVRQQNQEREIALFSGNVSITSSTANNSTVTLGLSPLHLSAQPTASTSNAAVRQNPLSPPSFQQRRFYLPLSRYVPTPTNYSISTTTSGSSNASVNGEENQSSNRLTNSTVRSTASDNHSRNNSSLQLTNFLQEHERHRRFLQRPRSGNIPPPSRIEIRRLAITGSTQSQPFRSRLARVYSNPSANVTNIRNSVHHRINTPTNSSEDSLNNNS